MDDILVNYSLLLEEVDEWFVRTSGLAGPDVSCRKGCSECCRGLFDITLLDALYLKSGFDRLPAEVRDMVRAKALHRFEGLRTLWPDFDHPYILNYRPEEDWEKLMPEEDDTPCALLGEDGTCLLYEHRPMTCRLNGLPLVDISGELFCDEWCTLNFIGKDPLRQKNLRWRFYEHFRSELQLFHLFTEQLIGRPVNELDTFIPLALLIDFSGFDGREWSAGFITPVR
jgi:Fe-S-cluster containining protein